MKIEEIKNLVEDYDKTYRADGLAPFVISKKYYLYPQNGEYGWPEIWPNCTSSGVYLIFDDKDEIIYVGESINLGNRLSDYFKYSENGGVKVIHNWSRFSILTITVPSSSQFERLALEEYLINKLNPFYNIRGKIAI